MAIGIPTSNLISPLKLYPIETTKPILFYGNFSLNIDGHNY